MDNLPFERISHLLRCSAWRSVSSIPVLLRRLTCMPASGNHRHSAFSLQFFHELDRFLSKGSIDPSRWTPLDRYFPTKVPKNFLHLGRQNFQRVPRTIFAFRTDPKRFFYQAAFGS